MDVGINGCPQVDARGVVTVGVSYFEGCRKKHSGGARAGASKVLLHGLMHQRSRQSHREKGDVVESEAKGCHDPGVQGMIGHRLSIIQLRTKRNPSKSIYQRRFLGDKSIISIIHGSDRKGGFIYTLEETI